MATILQAEHKVTVDSAKFQQVCDLIRGLDRNGPEWSEVREAQGIVKDLQKELGLAS